MSEDVRKLPSLPVRMETGPVQFGDDWPGVFLRGDNAGYYAMLLGHMLDEVEKGEVDVGFLDVVALRGLVSILESSRVK